MFTLTVILLFFSIKFWSYAVRNEHSESKPFISEYAKNKDQKNPNILKLKLAKFLSENIHEIDEAPKYLFDTIIFFTKKSRFYTFTEKELKHIYELYRIKNRPFSILQITKTCEYGSRGCIGNDGKIFNFKAGFIKVANILKFFKFKIETPPKGIDIKVNYYFYSSLG